ncbi:hypothetical protein E2C06_08025 [Dankookia rubra]|uniref:Uncharacterized protein n=1 Tax=Dankookia rubra TaxID=1442381 RepID=A0A4R5QKU6_9PROT|nr:hypothetical protein [Dankookia rubra]TDH63307.1 hypothetical protein E2C06_08025 [Dankookia rubra]
MASSDDAAASLNSVEVRSGDGASAPAATAEGERTSAAEVAPDQQAAAIEPPVDLAGLDADGDPSERVKRAHACALECGRVEKGTRAQLSAVIGQRLSIILVYGDDKHDAGLVRPKVETMGLQYGSNSKPWLDNVYAYHPELDPKDQAHATLAGQRANAVENLKAEVVKRLSRVPEPGAAGVRAVFDVYREVGGYTRLRHPPVRGGDGAGDEGEIPLDGKKLLDEQIKRGSRALGRGARAQRGAAAAPLPPFALYTKVGEMYELIDEEVDRNSDLGRLVVAARAEPEPVLALLGAVSSVGTTCVPQIPTKKTDRRGNPVKSGRHLFVRPGLSLLVSPTHLDAFPVVEIFPIDPIREALAPERPEGTLWANAKSLRRMEIYLGPYKNLFGFAFAHVSDPQELGSATHCRWVLSPTATKKESARPISMAMTRAAAWATDDGDSGSHPLDVDRDGFAPQFKTSIPRSAFKAHSRDYCAPLRKVTRDRPPILDLQLDGSVIAVEHERYGTEIGHDPGSKPKAPAMSVKVATTDWLNVVSALAALRLVGDVGLEVDSRGLLRFETRTAQATFWVWVPLCTRHEGVRIAALMQPMAFARWSPKVSTVEAAEEGTGDTEAPASADPVPGKAGAGAQDAATMPPGTKDT